MFCKDPLCIQIDHMGCVPYITLLLSITVSTTCLYLNISLQVKDLASVSLKQPVRIFVNSNTDVAPYLRQEFVRIRPNKEGDREAIVAGKVP